MISLNNGAEDGFMAIGDIHRDDIRPRHHDIHRGDIPQPENIGQQHAFMAVETDGLTDRFFEQLRQLLTGQCALARQGPHHGIPEFLERTHPRYSLASS